MLTSGTAFCVAGDGMLAMVQLSLRQLAPWRCYICDGSHARTGSHRYHLLWFCILIASVEHPVRESGLFFSPLLALAWVSMDSIDGVLESPR